MNIISSIDDFKSKIEQDKLVVCIFTVTWCPDCHFIDPFIEEIVSSFDKEILSYNVDVDKVLQVKTLHQVTGIPSFIAFSNGIEINRFVSRKRKTKEEIISFYQKSAEIVKQ